MIRNIGDSSVPWTIIPGLIYHVDVDEKIDRLQATVAQQIGGQIFSWLEIVPNF